MEFFWSARTTSKNLKMFEKCTGRPERGRWVWHEASPAFRAPCHSLPSWRATGCHSVPEGSESMTLIKHSLPASQGNASVSLTFCQLCVNTCPRLRAAQTTSCCRDALPRPGPPGRVSVLTASVQGRSLENALPAPLPSCLGGVAGLRCLAPL